MEHPLYLLWYGPKHKLQFWWRHRIKKLPFRIRHGFWPSETWNLDVTCAKWLAPRLKHLRDSTHGYPGELTEEKWHAYLTRMAETFEWIANDGYWDTPTDKLGRPDYDAIKQRTEQAQKDLELFAKYFMGLWD